MGVAYEQKKEFDIAIELYSKAILINQYDYLAWKYRGSLYLSMDKPNKAISDLEKAVNLRSDFGDAWYNLSKANYRMNNLPKAKSYLKKAIENGANVNIDYKTKLNL